MHCSQMGLTPVEEPRFKSLFFSDGTEHIPERNTFSTEAGAFFCSPGATIQPQKDMVYRLVLRSSAANSRNVWRDVSSQCSTPMQRQRHSAKTGSKQVPPRPFHAVRLHLVTILGSRNSRAPLCPREFHPSDNIRSIGQGRTPRFPDSCHARRA